MVIKVDLKLLETNIVVVVFVVNYFILVFTKLNPSLMLSVVVVNKCSSEAPEKANIDFVCKVKVKSKYS